ncbi:MAG: response regulator [Paracoccaceae bacterium]
MTSPHAQDAKSALKVFVIDDDEAIRVSLTRALTKRGFDVVTYASAAAFLDVCDDSFSGCIILDQGMPDMTGLELQQVLLKRRISLPIIFITGHAGVPESVLAMKSGALDFLEKPFRPEVLVERIETAFATLETKNAGLEKNNKASAKLASLTAREREIADFIVANPEQTTSKDLARALDVSPRTIDHHRARILEKLQIGSIVGLFDIYQSAKVATKQS